MEGLKCAIETTKQILALSTGMIALTITFLEKIVGFTTCTTVPWPLKASWILFGLTILLGLWTLMAITGTLDAVDRKDRGLPLNAYQSTAVGSLANGTNIKVPALLMLVSFFLAIILTILLGFWL